MGELCYDEYVLDSNEPACAVLFGFLSRGPRSTTYSQMRWNVAAIVAITCGLLVPSVSAQSPHTPPSLSIVSNSGTACFTVTISDLELISQGSEWRFQYNLKNTCSTPQLYVAEEKRIGETPALPGVFELGILNGGTWYNWAHPGLAPSLKFRPSDPRGSSGPPIEAQGVRTGSARRNVTETTPIFIWLASCDAYSRNGSAMTLFKAAAYLTLDTRIQCVANIQLAHGAATTLRANLEKEIQALIDQANDLRDRMRAIFTESEIALLACSKAKKGGGREDTCRSAAATIQFCTELSLSWNRLKIAALEEAGEATDAMKKPEAANGATLPSDPSLTRLRAKADVLLGIELPGCSRIVPGTSKTPLELIASWTQEEKMDFEGKLVAGGTSTQRAGSLGSSLFQGAVIRAQQEQIDPDSKAARLRAELDSERESARRQAEADVWYQQRVAAIYGTLVTNVQSALTQYSATLATSSAPLNTTSQPLPADGSVDISKKTYGTYSPPPMTPVPTGAGAARQYSAVLTCVATTAKDGYKQCVFNQCGRRVLVYWERAMQGIAPGSCYPSSDAYFGRLIGACEVGSDLDKNLNQCRK